MEIVSGIIIGDGSPSIPARLYSGRNSWRMRGIAARRETARSSTPRERMAILCNLLAVRAKRQMLRETGAWRVGAAPLPSGGAR